MTLVLASATPINRRLQRLKITPGEALKAAIDGGG